MNIECHPSSPRTWFKWTNEWIFNDTPCKALGLSKWSTSDNPFCDPNGTKDLTQPIKRRKRKKGHPSSTHTWFKWTNEWLLNATPAPHTPGSNERMNDYWMPPQLHTHLVQMNEWMTIECHPSSTHTWFKWTNEWLCKATPAPHAPGLNEWMNDYVMPPQLLTHLV